MSLVSVAYTSAVSRLHKLIPVYSFYSYWRIKEKLYAIASAGTIVNKSGSDTTGNFNTATESVCPKGWTLPSTKQIDANNDAANFEPVIGGNYYNSAPQGESTYGFWWAVEAYNNSYRYRLGYNGNKHNLSSYYYIRPNGLYIRCVSEEKTVTDLTYLQDMTGEIIRIS